ncbi:hypothetical protein P5673_022012 [Acropora cervicornis]|uniref:Uncharacterized protein n=1 Tax=Acropora cervicornis TaxID=6130 RepID=A0AAD9Q7A7_ACRCE|nr:hypothetical protein P5673_022012 [Acropora cervicornis]
MAATVPLSLSEFRLSEREELAKRRKKWLSRFRKLLVAMAAIDKKQQRPQLPQYAGRAVNKIFDVSPNTTATSAEENPFAKAFEALINYFTP